MDNDTLWVVILELVLFFVWRRILLGKIYLQILDFRVKIFLFKTKVPKKYLAWASPIIAGYFVGDEAVWNNINSRSPCDDCVTIVFREQVL